MIDSTNPRQLADNIRKLWEKFKSISGDLLPSRSTATTGQILKLTGENKTPIWADEYSYTPPAYSESEVNTGQKWIDGNYICSKTIVGTFGTIGQMTGVIIESGITGQLIDVKGYAITASGSLVPANCYIGGTSPISLNVFKQSDNKIIANISTHFSECDYKIVIYYTKPDLAPESRDDDTPEEPEEKKTTKKKTTK